AVALDGLAHLGVDVGGVADARACPLGRTCIRWKRRVRPQHHAIGGIADVHEEGVAAHQWPVVGIEVHGSAGGFGSPFCNSSIECRSGERMKAMLPSRGGRLMVTPIFMSLSQVA